MELEEIKEMLEKRKKRVNKNIEIYEHCYDLTIRDNCIKEKEAIEILLNLLENSIPKKKIEDKIEELKCEIDELNEKYNEVDKITDDVERCIQKTTFQTLLNVRYRKLDVLQEILEDK